MDNFQLYSIRCITNLHVGSGDNTYSIIDNQVQRDVVTNFPIINSSSLKGSLKEYLRRKVDDATLKEMFGHEEKGIGVYKIFPGMLLSIPVRSNKKAFFRATCPRIIKDFKSFIDSFDKGLGINFDELLELVDQNKNSCFYFDNNYDKEIKIEGIECEIIKKEYEKEKLVKIEKIFGQDLVILDDETFSNIVSELPVIARNKLENGESKNLWYEEIVPRESIFYFGVIQDQKYKEKFEEITKDAVQIGANATIGYGFCDIEIIKEDDKSE